MAKRTTRKRKNQPARAKTSYKRKTTVKKKKRSAQPKKRLSGQMS